MKLLVATFSLVAPSLGNQIRRTLESANVSVHKRKGECVPLDFQKSFYSVKLKLGTTEKNVNAVVDTGSDDLVITSKFATPSTDKSGKKDFLGYGSGDALVELATDRVQVGATVVEKQTIQLMEGNDFGFSIEGILPLGPTGEKSAWKFGDFSMCFHSGGAGSLQLGKNSASIPTSGQWEAKFSGISADGASTGIKGVAVPDSGTTLLMSPSATDLANLFEKICSKWSDCNGEQGNAVDAFYAAVEKDCGESVPSLTFDFAGGKSAKLLGTSYVVRSKTGKCMPAFEVDSSFSFWILGLPLFQSNQVLFSPASRKIGFTTGCGSCGSKLELQGSESAWMLDGPPRWPTRSSGNAQRHKHVIGDDEATNPNVVALVKHLDRVWTDGK